MEGKFPCVVCRKCVGINSILISFTGVRSLTDVVVLEVNWKGTISLMSDMRKPTDIVQDCPGIELNDQSLEIVEKFCYLVLWQGSGVDGLNSEI